MTKARKYTVQENFSAHYHVYGRCVQRVYLMGTDPLTGKCYDHRKEWLYQRISFLFNLFTIEVGGIAIMSTQAKLKRLSEAFGVAFGVGHG